MYLSLKHFHTDSLCGSIIIQINSFQSLQYFRIKPLGELKKNTNYWDSTLNDANVTDQESNPATRILKAWFFDLGLQSFH